MTNLDVIKLFAERDPSLLAEFFNKIYSEAWRSGANDDLYDNIYFDDDWLEFEYDTDWFRKLDVEDLL